MRSAAASNPTTCRRSAQIVRDAKAKNYRFSAFISGVANSAAFRMGRVAPVETTTEYK